MVTLGKSDLRRSHLPGATLRLCLTREAAGMQSAVVFLTPALEALGPRAVKHQSGG